jgi:hypothetical protein
MRVARFRAVIAIACAMLPALSGCASSCPEQAGACKTHSPGDAKRTPSPDEVICFREPQTGTHIVETRCYKRSEVDERRQADRDMLERAQMNSNRPVRQKDQAPR